jgi:hypothetical protein
VKNENNVVVDTFLMAYRGGDYSDTISPRACFWAVCVQNTLNRLEIALDKNHYLVYATANVYERLLDVKGKREICGI